jgi:actin-like ATPase involved in cell morphogenesis
VIPGAWVIAIDFGTTNTVAAVGDVAGVRPMNINGRTIMPSAVVLESQRRGRQRWLVGEYAINAAAARMASFERKPKSCIPDGTVFLGGRNIPVEDVIAAVLRHAVEEAHRQRGPRAPARFVITHPAGWADGRVAVLLRAARAATNGVPDWPDPEPLPEPVAAARGVLLTNLPSPARIAVLDLGGGTVDVAVVDRDGDQLRVVGIPQGTDQVGGEEFDLRLARLMTEEVQSPRHYNELVVSDDVDDRELAMEIRTEAQLVKEQLSTVSSVAAAVPIPPRGQGGRRSVQINRTQLENLIKGGDGGRPGLVDAVRLVVAARTAAPPGPPSFHVYLVGGSSRIPMLGWLVQNETNTTPISQGDPSTAVAEGAADWARQIPLPLPPPLQPPERTWRNRLREWIHARGVVLVRSLVAGVVVITAISAVLIPRANVPPDCGSGPTADPSCPVTPTTPSTPPQIGVRNCKSIKENGCAEAINAASRAMWPDMTGRDCAAKDSRYGVDLYSTECTTSTMSYAVYWRKAIGALIPVLVEQMTRPELNEFRVGNDPEKVGTQLGGTRRTATGDRFTCVFEYTDYPVTMVLDGPNADSTVTICQELTFLDTADMRSAFANR